MEIISNSRSIDLTFRTAALDEQDEQILRMNGMKCIDEFVSGNYEFYLMEMQEDWPGQPKYHLALQAEGKRCTDPNQQFEKSDFDFGKRKIANKYEVVKKIVEWLQKYGELAIGTFNEPRLQKYLSLLRWCGFNATLEHRMVETPYGTIPADYIIMKPSTISSVLNWLTKGKK